ncbi:MAG: hypothetical protein JW910_01930 [Anaerolineae bacterium]|nr:hypothetical protein [Anaerolineae bacterium]
MRPDLSFTDDDWTCIERDWLAWWAGELARPLVIIERIEAGPGDYRPLDQSPAYYTTDFPLETPTADVIAHYAARLESTRWYGDAWPKWWPNFGPGIMAGFLGGRVFPSPGTVWFEPADDLPLHEREVRCDPDNVWWRRVRDLTQAAVAVWGDRVSVAHTDLGGNLDILASLHGTEKLLIDVLDAPGEVARLAEAITRLWLGYYDELDACITEAGRGTTPWAPIWSPGRCYMLQCDFAYMISPDMFERFVMPDIAACCDALDHGFYHLDGKGQIAHLDMLLSLERLRGVQWIPGAGQQPPEQWLPLLARIRDAGKLCQLFVTAEGARTITRELGGRGFAFAIEDAVDLTADEIAALLHELGTGADQPVRLPQM